ncbi:uricase [Basidiobolus meristosporus CBS 931.73]|uniref:Uricase n=1 Tax=Basidiobolus meristosporus CBS 931.73 TaxID=1314790 RepID=A0A1Y1Z1R5_9FUNG|nr:uricase [Basidiobolus meristosporus CBS 931.73]|eukprot:ORY04230.1 uricase [Basidiobolus meristosporus CBS 931.73]
MSSAVELKRQAYGKAKVRVTKAIRHTPQWNDIVELTVQVLLEGDFEEAYTEADNSKVVPTDTVKNTCYIIAKKSNHVQTIERYGYELGKHFVDKYPHVTHAHVHIVQLRWTRINVNGEPHPHSFYRDGSETRETWVTVSANDLTVSRDGKVSIESRLKDLLVLKSTGSSFTNFHRCENTTLQDATDRIFSTSVDAKWTYNLEKSKIEEIPFDEIAGSVREITLGTFATDDSASVQATMYKMGEKVLAENVDVTEISYALPNKHYISVNLKPFNLPNEGKDMDIFQPISDPSGYITATIARRQ